MEDNNKILYDSLGGKQVAARRVHKTTSHTIRNGFNYVSSNNQPDEWMISQPPKMGMDVSHSQQQIVDNRYQAHH